MRRKTFLRVFIPLFALLLLISGTARAVDFALPASDWYAIAWVEQSDTLHWINANGEQASIPRPELEGTISQAQTRLHVSPDGRYLVVISPLLNGREGIGFYNFQTGQFIQIHESQPNEVFLPAGRAPFTEFSGQFAIPLRNQITGDWRIIVFETATGNVIDVLQRTDPGMPPGFVTDPTWWPSIAQFNLDEALNTLEVRFQFVTQPNAMPFTFQSFVWRIPPGGNADTVSPDTLTFSQQAGLDINPTTGEIVMASFDQQYGVPASSAAANTINVLPASDQPAQVVAVEPAGSARLPLWLNDGEWIGYYREDGVHAPHWLVMTAAGQSGLPLSPGIISIYHTRDGFLSKSSTAWRLDHATTLDLEGFGEPMGTTIFHPGTSFAVIYTTPANTPFLLPSVAEPVVPLGGPDDLQAPVSADCPGAAVPRLTVGGYARVAINENLNIRIEPAGSLLTQIGPGTVVPVLDGPVCGEGYLYWRVRLPQQNNAEGWAAEGAPEEYFLEPYTPDVQPDEPLPLAPVPTPVPTIIAPNLDLVAPATEPSRPLDIVAIPICPNSLPTQLEVGALARTAQPDGTLAMRINLTDEFPTHQIPSGLTVQILAGPQCRDGFRMWQVSLTLNGQPVIGWVAEANQQIYYLMPGPARLGRTS